MKVLITKKTAAEADARYNVTRHDVPCTIQVDGDLAANTIPINFIGIDGTTATAAYDSSGVALAFSATKTAVAIAAPCHLQFVKGITTNAVGLKLVNS